MRLSLIVAALMLAAPFQAQGRTLTATGQLTSIYDNSLTPQSGLVGIGDQFNLTIEFDESLAVRTSNPANGPGYGQYVLPLSYHAQIGNFSFNGQTEGRAGNYLSFYDDFEACGPTCKVDAAYFSQVGFAQTDGPYLVDPGVGNIYSYFDVQFFDFSGTGLSVADLGALDQLNNFTSINLTYGLSNATESRAVYLNAANASFVLSAVPEPSTWAMMLVGFGMMGAGVRYRRGRLSISLV